MNERVHVSAGPATEEVPVLIDWPRSMWFDLPVVGDRFALEVYHVEHKADGNIACKLRPVKL